MKRFLPLMILIILLLAGGMLFFLNMRKREKPSSILISGRVEADELLISPEIPGRIKKINFSEGQTIITGKILAELDDTDILSRIDELKSRIKSAEKNRDAKKRSLDYLRRKVDIGIKEAEQLYNIAKARHERALNTKVRQERRYKRFQNLLEKEAISRERFEDVKLSYQLSLSALKETEEELKRAETRLELAKAEKTRIEAGERELEGIEQSIEALKSSLRTMELQLEKTRIRASRNGIVLRKTAEPGEVAGSGSILGVMIDPTSLYVKTYLPEPHLGEVSLNEEVKIITDSFPDKIITGKICHISEEAEFTPREVQSREERIKQVFEIKVCIPSDSEGMSILKKGMPVEVEIPLNDRTKTR
ncbi:MAG: HlyD family efflux transporter periplasmic adaptor subunit [Nitrospirae bacterium]|nr:MAG: HlyD family efflux transporter periplasmic adaptor subunit [Nitrospirota bacterium]